MGKERCGVRYLACAPLAMAQLPMTLVAIVQLAMAQLAMTLPRAAVR